MISIIFINIQIVVFIVMALYIWFDTDAFIEWGELFHLKFLKYKQYNDVKKSALSSMAAKSYSDFLLFHYGKYFLIRLITCPICFSVWVNFVALGVLYSVIGVRNAGYHWTGNPGRRN